MLHVLNQVLDVFGFFAVSIKLVSKELTILILIYSASQLIRSLFTRNNQLELIGMTKNNSVQMLDCLFFSYLETIYKHFGLGFWHDIKLLTFLNDRAVLFVDTQGVNLDVVLLNFAGTDLGLAFLQSVNQEPCDRWIFRDVDDVRSLGVLLLHSGADYSKTCLFKCLVSAFFEFFLFSPFFFQLLFDLLF